MTMRFIESALEDKDLQALRQEKASIANAIQNNQKLGFDTETLEQELEEANTALSSLYESDINDIIHSK